jgi:hypothetical protein
MPNRRRVKSNSRSKRISRTRSTAVHLSDQNRYALFDLGWFHAQPKLSFQEVKVLLVLAGHADIDRGTCFPSLALIALEAGIADVRGVRRALRGLRQKGVILQHLRPNSTTLYELLRPPNAEAVRRIHDYAPSAASVKTQSPVAT